MCMCLGSWAGSPECPRGGAGNREGLPVPGNILVHVLVCWVRICHGMLCFWGILSVPVWDFAGFINLHPLGLFMSLRSRSSGVFQFGAHCVCVCVCVCLASPRKRVWVIPFQFFSLRFLHPPEITPQPLPSPQHLALLHSLPVPCLPSGYQFSVAGTKYIFAG